MILVIIGLIVGLILGLTGAGGALLAIPLFIDLLHVSLKEATVLSLTVVILGALINFVTNKNKAAYKVVFTFAVAGSAANFATIPLKGALPDWVIALILGMITLFSIKGVWSKDKEIQESGKQASTLFTVGIGACLGLITTLTGLGGGVLIVPILKRFYGFTYANALPSSLLTITLLATTSLLFQLRTTTIPVDLNGMLLMAVGVTTSALLLREILKRVDPKKADKTRKLTFTAVTLYTMASLLKAVI